eukprot:10800114-Ditylum_brightwellii.AAC.1
MLPVVNSLLIQTREIMHEIAKTHPGLTPGPRDKTRWMTTRPRRWTSQNHELLCHWNNQPNANDRPKVDCS